MTSPSRGSPMPIRTLTGEFFVSYLAYGLDVTLFGHIIPKAVGLFSNKSFWSINQKEKYKF